MSDQPHSPHPPQSTTVQQPQQSPVLQQQQQYSGYANMQQPQQQQQQASPSPYVPQQAGYQQQAQYMSPQMYQYYVNQQNANGGAGQQQASSQQQQQQPQQQAQQAQYAAAPMSMPGYMGYNMMQPQQHQYAQSNANTAATQAKIESPVVQSPTVTVARSISGQQPATTATTASPAAAVQPPTAAVQASSMQQQAGQFPTMQGYMPMYNPTFAAYAHATPAAGYPGMYNPAATAALQAAAQMQQFSQQFGAHPANGAAATSAESDAFRTVIECGKFDPQSNQRQLHEYSPYFGKVVDIYTAVADPLRRPLVRASTLAEKFNCATNKLGMYLARRKQLVDGIYQSSTFRGKPPGKTGLKSGGYFVTLEACKDFEQHFHSQHQKKTAMQTQLASAVAAGNPSLDSPSKASDATNSNAESPAHKFRSDDISPPSHNHTTNPVYPQQSPATLNGVASSSDTHTVGADDADAPPHKRTKYQGLTTQSTPVQSSASPSDGYADIVSSYDTRPLEARTSSYSHSKSAIYNPISATELSNAIESGSAQLHVNGRSQVAGEPNVERQQTDFNHYLSSLHSRSGGTMSVSVTASSGS